MIDLNLINSVMSVAAGCSEDNTYTSWTANIEITFGSVIIMDTHYVYIKAKTLDSYKEPLVNISMPLSCFEKCRQEVKQHLIEILVDTEY